MKRICSEEEDLKHKLADLESWLVNRGFRAESVRREMQIVNSIDRQVLLEKHPNVQEDSHVRFNFPPCFIHHKVHFHTFKKYTYKPHAFYPIPQTYT